MEANSERSRLSRAMAKALAYRDCGKQAMAEAWAVELVRQLGCAGILRNPNPQPMIEVRGSKLPPLDWSLPEITATRPEER